MLRAISQVLQYRAHESLADLFFHPLAPCAGASILDLRGGNGDVMSWRASRAFLDVSVADIDSDALETASRREFRTVRLAEGEALAFEKNSFDIVFCNSVIEHVTLPKVECLPKSIIASHPRAELMS